MITRRHALAAAAITAAGVASGRANGARRTVTFAAYAGLFQELYEPAVIAAFQRAYPGIDIFWYPISSPSQALAMLRREKANPSLDAVLLDPSTSRVATAEGLLEPLTRATLPVGGA